MKTDFSKLLSRNTKITVISDGLGYSSRIEDITDNSLLITIPTRQGKPLSAKKGTVLSISILLHDGRAMFESAVKNIIANNIHMYVVDLPRVMAKKQLRQFFRVDVRLYVNVYLGTMTSLSEKLAKDEDIAYTEVLIDNLSGGGCRVTVDKLVPISKFCVFDFSKYNMGLGLIPAVGTRAVYRKEAAKKHICFSFQELADADRDKIVRYVTRRQLEIRRRRAEIRD